MSNIEDEKLDMLLFQALENSEIPTSTLNYELKEKLRIKADKKSRNVWNFLVCASIIFTVLISLMLIMFIANLLIHIIVIGSMFISIISNLLITYFGMREYNLNEGAVVKL